MCIPVPDTPRALRAYATRLKRVYAAVELCVFVNTPVAILQG